MGRALNGTDRASGKRKEDHLRIALQEDVAFRGVTSGFESYYFVHQALPEVDYSAVDTSVDFLGKRLAAPLVVSAMVGGIDAAERINVNLARAAQSLGVAMGLGSLRCAIEDPSTRHSYEVRKVAPDILLFSNLGAVQLNNGYGIKECRLAVDMVQADALVLHLNPLQEALQAEGNTNFAGLLDKIARVCRELPVPVIVKEVGWGISEEVARSLLEAGVGAIETGGAGGTSWGEIERLRSKGGPNAVLIDGLARSLASWGIPTAESIEMVRRAAPKLPLVAGGGVRTGLDVAKAMVLGADAAGMAAPLLGAADESSEAVVQVLSRVIAELRLAMFLTGAPNLAVLKQSKLLRRKATT